MSKQTTRTHCYKDRRSFFLALSVLFILFLAYIYFVSAAVAHVVVRQELSQEITDVQTRISELEAQYILAKDGVALEMAMERGFTVTEEKVFVAKQVDAVALSVPVR